ncbi:MAG: metalloregulator ArsR/SmtB family transcription factor [Gemmatimonadota bacterium]|nr:metalloregulator ArsR/SmtB family transcription factor [Gemmatimonadota bacterium]
MVVPTSEVPDPLRTAVSPRRLEILELIWDDELAVNEIAAQLPVSVPAVSQHLAKLRDAGLVEVRAQGRRRFYRAARESMGPVEAVLASLLGSEPADDGPSGATIEPAGTRERAIDQIVSSETEPPGSTAEADVDSFDGAAGAAGAAAPRGGGDESKPPPFAEAIPPSAEAIPAIETATRVEDELVSWYRQGFEARAIALRKAGEAMASGRRDAADSIRRIARSLTRSTIAERFPDISVKSAFVTVQPNTELSVAAERLTGALRQEAAREDDRVATILVVEDSKMEAALTRAIVGGPNREVLLAASAEEATHVLERRRVDLMVLDLGLPGEDGRDLLGRLGRSPRTAGIPVILLTGKDDPRTQTEVLALGADTFFTKPADSAVLSVAASMMLERSAVARSTGRQDPLTGLKNRPVFLSDVRQLTSAATRAGLALSIAIIDLDGLAEVNDAHGSDIGDALVRTIADALKRSFRESDTVARWSGSKFAVLFANSAAEGGAIALEKLRAATTAAPLSLPNGATIVPTWHAGVASIRDRTDVDAAIARATRRLQLARSKVGTRIVWSDESVRGDNAVIMLIEDDQILGDLIEHRFRREGFDVTRFVDGAEAVADAASIEASAVVLDTMLPGADGFEVLRHIRDAPALAGVPVVVLTFGGDHDAGRAFDLGASDTLAKPFAVKELVARVSRLVQEYEEGRAGG